MSNFWKSGIIVLLVIGALYIIFLRGCKPSGKCPTADEVLIKKNVWDSIQTLANKPPIIITDTVFIKQDTIIENHKPIVTIVDKTDSTIKTYKDSLVRNNIKVWTAIKVRGTLLDIHWKYIPIVTQITTTKTEYVPKIINNPVPLMKRNIYFYGIVGGSATSFIPGIGIDYVTKKNTEVGYLYQRLGTQNIHSIKVGIGIRL